MGRDVEAVAQQLVGEQIIHDEVMELIRALIEEGDLPAGMLAAIGEPSEANNWRDKTCQWPRAFIQIKVGKRWVSFGEEAAHTHCPTSGPSAEFICDLLRMYFRCEARVVFAEEPTGEEAVYFAKVKGGWVLRGKLTLHNLIRLQ